MLYLCNYLRIANHTNRSTGEIKPAYSFSLQQVKRDGDKLSLTKKSPLSVWQTDSIEDFDISLVDSVPFVADFDLDIDQFGDNVKARVCVISDVKPVTMTVG